MDEGRALWRNLRVAFTLVPWRMRPKIILILLGSIAVALLDMFAVLLMVPVMQLLTGAPIESTPGLAQLARLLDSRETTTLLMTVLVAMVLLMVSKNVFALLFRWWSTGIMVEAQADATEALMDLYTTSGYVHQRRRKSEDISQAALVYVPTSFSGVLSGSIQVIVDGVAMLAILVALLSLSPLATVAALVLFGGMALVLQALTRARIVRYGDQARQAHLESWGFLTPTIDGYKELRLTEVAGTLAARFSEARRRAAHHGRTAGILGELPRYLMEVVMILGILVIAGLLFTMGDGRDAITFLGVFAVASIRVMPTLVRVLGTVAAIRANSPNLEALANEVETLRAEDEREDSSEIIRSFDRDDIVFEDVTFTFPDADEPILKGVSGRIPAGSTVALVGGSGAGKTTFVELLMALLRPAQGSITVGGVSIHDFPISWRRQLGVVSQDGFLVDDTLRNNVMFGSQLGEVEDEERLAKAIDMAQLRDVVSSLPQGLETVVGYRGARVSGGQRQRIGIARALYRQPDVLILDEATSALDNETEARITRTIEELHGRMTIVVVAHRLSTIKNSDAIIFFSGGRVEAVGTMAELVESTPEFAELVRLGRLI